MCAVMLDAGVLIEDDPAIGSISLLDVVADKIVTATIAATL